MKILYILDEEFPFPPNSGKRIRSFNILKQLQDKFPITYLCRGEGKPPSIQELPNVKIEYVEKMAPKKTGLIFYLKLLINLFSKLPYVVTSHKSEAMRNELSKQFKPDEDIILVEWSPYSINVPEAYFNNAVIAAHNVESRIWGRYLETERNPLKRLYIWIQWKKMVKFESSFKNNFRAIIAVSESDKVEFTEMGVGPVTVVPNGVDTDTIKPYPEVKASKTILLMGSLDWRPNIDAIEYFIDDIWPAVIRADPEIILNIVGRNPTQNILSINKLPSVHVFGNVESMEPFLENSVLQIVPLRIGGGSRLKILESWAAGLPVVSTSIGAEGLSYKDGENIIIRDEPASFADAVINLINDSEGLLTLARNGRRLVEGQYSWKSIGDIQIQLLKEMTP